MSSYRRAVQTLTPEQRAQLQKRLGNWSTRSRVGRVIVPNLNPLERFLPAGDMKELLLAICNSPEDDLFLLGDAYKEACYRHIRRGGPAKMETLPILLGRAVERSSFIYWLFQRSGYFTRQEEAEDFVERLINGDPLEGREPWLLMSQYSAWATWDLDNSENDPFVFGSAEHVRASLGLDPEARTDRGLLLLVYERPQTLRLFRPTVADAGLFLFFQPPPPPIKSYGLTKPWEPGIAQDSSYSPSPKPEVLHEPIEMLHFKLPVRILF